MEGLKILLIDDEEDLISAMAARLAIRGFQVDTATSGADALQRVSGSDFNVIVLDVKMPGIDGLELMAEIKRKHPDLPVILFTGHSSVADAEKGMQEGAFDYIMKPIDLDRLTKKIRDAAGGKKDQAS